MLIRGRIMILKRRFGKLLLVSHSTLTPRSKEGEVLCKVWDVYMLMLCG
jgi:hypothetical protein